MYMDPVENLALTGHGRELQGRLVLVTWLYMCGVNRLRVLLSWTVVVSRNTTLADSLSSLISLSATPGKVCWELAGGGRPKDHRRRPFSQPCTVTGENSTWRSPV